MDDIVEITQVAQEYASLRGMCAIRRVGDGYADIIPGDAVIVRHVKDPEDISVLATEFLLVRCTAIAGLRELVHANLYGVMPGSAYGEDEPSYDEVMAYVGRFYEDTSGDFIAIHFN